MFFYLCVKRCKTTKNVSYLLLLFTYAYNILYFVWYIEFQWFSTQNELYLVRFNKHDTFISVLVSNWNFRRWWNVLRYFLRLQRYKLNFHLLDARSATYTGFKFHSKNRYFAQISFHSLIELDNNNKLIKSWKFNHCVGVVKRCYPNRTNINKNIMFILHIVFIYLYR